MYNTNSDKNGDDGLSYHLNACHEQYISPTDLISI
jgi:hypothetical protein